MFVWARRDRGAMPRPIATLSAARSPLRKRGLPRPLRFATYSGRASAHARDSLYEVAATIALLSHHHPTRCCLSTVTNGLQVRQIYWPVDCDSHVSVSAWASSSKGMTRKPRSIIPLLLSFLRLLLTMRKAPCLPAPPLKTSIVCTTTL